MRILSVGQAVVELKLKDILSANAFAINVIFDDITVTILNRL
jgi:hypothetical protein